MSSTVAQFILTDLPTKSVAAWKIDIPDQGRHWIPYSCITGFEPATKKITIKTWILRQKNIKYKTK